MFSIPYAEKYISHAKYSMVTTTTTVLRGHRLAFLFLLSSAYSMESYLDSHGMSTCSMHSPINDAKLTRPQNFIGENLVGFRNVFFILFRFWLFRSSTEVKTNSNCEMWKKNSSNWLGFALFSLWMLRFDGIYKWKFNLKKKKLVKLTWFCII